MARRVLRAPARPAGFGLCVLAKRASHLVFDIYLLDCWCGSLQGRAEGAGLVASRFWQPSDRFLMLYKGAAAHALQYLF